LACGKIRGLRRPDRDSFDAAHALAAELIGGPVARASTLAAVDTVHPGTILIHLEGGVLTGLLALLPLRQAGREALLADRFDGLRPDLDLISTPAERPSAVYAWGCAARTRPAARAVMSVTAALPEEAYPGVNFFARAATPAGLRALTSSLGYAPVGSHGLLRRIPPFRRAA
jgi:hypothetical protein